MELVSNSEILDPQHIWEMVKDCFSDDCLYRISCFGEELIMHPAECTDGEQRYDYAFWLLGNCLQDLCLEWEHARLTRYRHAWVTQKLNPLITGALSNDREVEREKYLDSQRLFSSGQRAAFDIIINTIENELRPNSFFLQGLADTGLCVASSGIASHLLPNSNTARSLFKIPIDCTEESICRIQKQSYLAKLLRHTSLIIWDEVIMQLKHKFSATDRLLRDACEGEGEVVSSEIFGGVPELFGGYFAQILPVAPKGRREQVVNACISCWAGWHLVKPLF